MVKPSTPALRRNFESRIERLDLALFDAIASQTTRGCRLAMLTAQRAVRNRYGSYVYLEIGSHLGGSIQTHLLDPRCRRIYSVDSRPPAQPDDRGQVFEYENNSTQRMLDKLRAIDSAAVDDKVVCFECDASQLDPAQIDPPPHLFLIDGEHTRRAVLSDFTVCHRLAGEEALVLFHDRGVIEPAIRQILKQLRRQGVRHRGAPMAGAVYAIGIGPDEALDALVSASHEPRTPPPILRARDMYWRYAPGWLQRLLHPVVRSLTNRLFKD